MEEYLAEQMSEKKFCSNVKWQEKNTKPMEKDLGQSELPGSRKIQKYRNTVKFKIVAG